MVERRQFFRVSVIDITVYLPVKSLVRFRCVSKFWLALLADPTFINQHFLKRRKKCNMLLIRSYYPTPIDDDRFSFRKMDSPQLEEVLPYLSIPLLKDLYKCNELPGNVYLLGPCSGLVCIACGISCIMFCNPALREFKQLPDCPFSCPEGRVEDTLGLGFGSDSCTNDFKFVFIRSTNDKRYSPNEYRVVVHLYNSSSDSWRQVDENAIKKTYLAQGNCTEVLFNSICHWSATSDLMQDYGDDIILYFDFNSEGFTQLLYPDYLKVRNKTQCWLTILNQCLGLLLCDIYSMELNLIEGWIMTEYGVTDSWTKQFVIRPCRDIAPLLPWKNDEWILVATRDGQLESYALYTDETEKFQVYGVNHSLCAVKYEESLITLKRKYS